MRFLSFFISLALTIGLIWALQQSFVVKGKPLPPIGPFINPFTGFWQNAETRIGNLSDAAFVLPGLEGKVTVQYDSLHVPHIFAENANDAARVQGYVTARDRLWQMDITTRNTSGRLSEVLGERTLAIDRETRRKGLVFAAENNLKGWQKSPENMAVIQAYCEGVNAWVHQLTPATLPIEFKLLNYQPEEWTPLKCALIVESMAETLCSREDDVEATNTLQYFGKENFQKLFPDWGDPNQKPIVPDMGQWKNARQPAQTAPGAIGLLENEKKPLHFQNPKGDTPFDREIVEGSNNWAVSGAKTLSHKPILCNDPHLQLTLPSVWYQIQINTPEQNCTGVSLPGLPAIIIGYNENIAWGITNAGHDVSDWFKIKWIDRAKHTYELDGAPQQATAKIESYAVKGLPNPVLDTVWYTSWGPVVASDPSSPWYDCALKWISHLEPDKEQFHLFPLLNKGKNFADYQQALSGFDAPAQNFVMATASGDIAIQVQGRFPVKRTDQGKFVQDGSLSSNDWQGFIPENQVPLLKNPDRGFVFSANQHSTPPSYPWYYNGSFDHFRARRAYDRLDQLKNITPDSMKALQLDIFSYRAADGLPALLRLLDKTQVSAAAKPMLDALEHWDYRYDKDAIAPTLFEMWFDSTYTNTFDEMAAIEAKHIPIAYPESWKFIEMLQRDTSNIFFDIAATPEKENARAMVKLAFEKMAATAATGMSTGALQWGKFRGLNITHLARLDGFSRNNLIASGHRNALNAITKTHGPSWRMIVEMGETVHGIGIYPGGQSGNPGSFYYDNMVDSWLAGQYNEVLLLKEADPKNPKIIATQTYSGSK